MVIAMRVNGNMGRGTASAPNISKMGTNMTESGTMEKSMARASLNLQVEKRMMATGSGGSDAGREPTSGPMGNRIRESGEMIK